jgi:hypothetical protein
VPTARSDIGFSPAIRPQVASTSPSRGLPALIWPVKRSSVRAARGDEGNLNSFGRQCVNPYEGSAPSRSAAR